ncbi:hypothetical protein BHM03_00002223 [Ensete ventricosum]|nr:hypothetical protein BHM03_00002223 [Ensete ventricosum]
MVTAARFPSGTDGEPRVTPDLDASLLYPHKKTLKSRRAVGLCGLFAVVDTSSCISLRLISLDLALIPKGISKHPSPMSLPSETYEIFENSDRQHPPRHACLASMHAHSGATKQATLLPAWPRRVITWPTQDSHWIGSPKKHCIRLWSSGDRLTTSPLVCSLHSEACRVRCRHDGDRVSRPWRSQRALLLKLSCVGPLSSAGSTSKRRRKQGLAFEPCANGG